MKVKVEKKQEPVYEELEIEFPIYFRYSDGIEASHWEVWLRIEENGAYTSVKHASQGRGSKQYEVEIEKWDKTHVLPRELGNYLHRTIDYDRSTAEEFDKAMAKVREVAK